MKLPMMSDKAIMRPAVMTSFGGINHNLNAGDGELYDMRNLSSREYPLLTPRKKRGIVGTLNKPNGLDALDKPWWVDGTGFYFDGEKKGTVADSKKQFAAMGSLVLIFPDKAYYDTEKDEFGKLEVEQQYSGIQFLNGTFEEVPAYANTIYKSGAAWTYLPGDAISISGCVDHPQNNKTVVIREVDGDYLRFYENTFTLDSTIRYTADAYGLMGGTYYYNRKHFTVPELSEGDTLTWVETEEEVSITAVIGGVTSTITVEDGIDGYPLEFSDIPTDYTESGTVTISFGVPNMDFVCVNENRLWGCKGDTIYASALGNPRNFYVFEGLSTDSWTSDTVGAGDFTGCISYQGYPTFFKAESICKVQGDRPSNFQWTITDALGVKDGCERSLAVVGDTLFYLSRAGICAYNGWYPTVISYALGANTKWQDAAGGSDSIRYYVSMKDDTGYNLYTYDTRYGTWHREDETHAVDFAFWNEGLYMLTSLGQMVRIDGSEGTAEGPIDWEAEFGDSVRFYETTDGGSQNKKGILRFQMRCELAAGSVLKVLVRYEDNDEWEEVGTILGPAKKQSYNLPLILRRCDYYRLKLVGSGDAVVYSLTEVRYSGSTLQGGAVTLPTV